MRSTPVVELSRSNVAARPKPLRHYGVELLEDRRLLTGTLASGVALRFDAQNDIGLTGYHNIVSNGLLVYINRGTSVYADEDVSQALPSGTITIGWYGGTTLGTQPIDPSTANGGTQVYIGSQINFTLNQADAGSRVNTGAYKGDYILYWYYNGDATFAPTHRFDEDDFAEIEHKNTIEAGGVISTEDESSDTNDGYALAVSFGATDFPSVTAQPTNTAVGGAIGPVQVAELDSDGTIDASSSASITVSLASTSTGTGTLSGTKTVATSGGVATFSDLSISTAGQYSLTFTDSTGGTTASGLFQVSDGQLVFTTQPAGGAANKTLNPVVTVSLEHGDSTVITDNSTSVVTLNLFGTNSTNPITGNTATLVDGVATFPDLKLGKSGTYTLQATDDESDTDGLSKKFSIGGGTIAFAPQPADGDASAVLTFAVTLRDDKHRVETDSTDSLQLSLNNTAPGNGATLSGTTTVQFVNGVARFTDAQDVSIDTPGKYSFTASVVDESNNLTGAAAAVTSRTFKVSGFHLVFQKAPTDGDVNVPVPLTVAIKDGRNRTMTSVNGGQVRVGFQQPTGNLVNQFAFVDTAGFINGVATLSGTNAPKFSGYGTCVFEVVRFKDATTSDDNTLEVRSKVVRIFGNKVVFILQPKQTNPGVPIEYKAAIEDRHNKIINTFDGFEPFERIDAVNATQPRTISNNGPSYNNPTFTHGIADATGPGRTSLSTSQVGTFRIFLTAIPTAGMETTVSNTGLEPATSAVFRVAPYRFEFTQQPTNGPVGTAVTATLTMVDSGGHTVAVPDGLDGFSLFVALVSTANPGVNLATTGALSQGTTANYTGGPFPISLATDGLTAGRYRLEVTVTNSSTNLFPISALGSLIDPDFVTTPSKVFSIG